MESNGDQPARLNSRTITVWLPKADIDYAAEIAAEMGIPRNRAIRYIIQEHRERRNHRLAAAREERLAKRRERRSKPAPTVGA